jgi:uncharacterized protein BH0073
MRLDKYLKVSRLIKRRTVAKDVCSGGKVEINGKVAKAGSEVKVGDKLSIHFGDKVLEVTIKDVKENVRASEASSLYEVLSS